MNNDQAINSKKMFFSTSIFGEFSKFDRDQLFMVKDLIEYAKSNLINSFEPLQWFSGRFFLILFYQFLYFKIFSFLFSKIQFSTGFTVKVCVPGILWYSTRIHTKPPEINNCSLLILIPQINNYEENHLILLRPPLLTYKDFDLPFLSLVCIPPM